MNARILFLLLAVSTSAALPGCIQEADSGAAVTDDTTSSSTNLDGDGFADSIDEIVPYKDFVYVDQGIVASLENTFLVGWGLGGTDGEYDYCSENLPIERFDGQIDWPESLSIDKVRFFFPDSVEIFFGNPRTFNPGECDISTDGGYDSWAILENLNGVDEAVCPNPLDGNRLGLYLMKDEDGVFAPGCSGFAVAPDENRDSDNDGTADVDDDSGDSDSDSGDCADADGDGYEDEACGGDDCDDGWYWNHPGAAEANDEVDNDCDSLIDEDCESDDAANETCD